MFNLIYVVDNGYIYNSYLFEFLWVKYMLHMVYILGDINTEWVTDQFKHVFNDNCP